MDDIPTPALIVDRSVARSNADRMLARAKASSVRYRPHVKTHKTVEGALLQHGGKTGPITVSTLAEAEFFAAAGFDDITYGVPVSPAKIPRVAALQTRLRSFHVLVDHIDACAALEAFGRAHDVGFSSFLKVDTGAGRSGVDPSAPGTLELIRYLARSNVIALSGLLSHAGHSYGATSHTELRAIAADEAARLSDLASDVQKITEAPCLRSVGATPTASVAQRFEGCDEARPGNYVSYDATQVALGVASDADCAATVLTTIIGVHPERNRIIIDAGALALSKDAGAHRAEPPSYGIVRNAVGLRLPMRLCSLTQEHGIIDASAVEDWSPFRIGTRLSILPNHSCLTAAMFSRYHVVDDGQCVAEWSPVRGW